MSLQKTPYISNVVAFKQPEKKTQNQVTKTIENVEELLNIWDFSLNKEDIISAIIMWDGTVSDPNTALHMMNADYFDLYEELLDMVSEDARPFYFNQWYNIVYDKKSLKIYFVDVEEQQNKVELDISLLPNNDFSDITIQLSYKWEILFIENSEWSWSTWMTPFEINWVENNTYINHLSEQEKYCIQQNKSKKESIIWAITTNFSETIVADSEIVDTLWEYSRLQLIEILVKMIISHHWEKHNLIVNPFTPLLIQKTHKTYLEDISFQLNTDEKTYKTTIEVINEKWNILFIISA